MEPLLNVKHKNHFKFNNFWSVKLFRKLWNDKYARYLLESFPTIPKAELRVQNVGTELCDLSVWELKWPGAPSFLFGYMYVDAAPQFVSFQTNCGHDKLQISSTTFKKLCSCPQFAKFFNLIQCFFLGTCWSAVPRTNQPTLV
jgi:hypothetical protein